MQTALPFQIQIAIATSTDKFSAVFQGGSIDEASERALHFLEAIRINQQPAVRRQPPPPPEDPCRREGTGAAELPAPEPFPTRLEAGERPHTHAGPVRAETPDPTAETPKAPNGAPPSCENQEAMAAAEADLLPADLPAESAVPREDPTSTTAVRGAEPRAPASTTAGNGDENTALRQAQSLPRTRSGDDALDITISNLEEQIPLAADRATLAAIRDIHRPYLDALEKIDPAHHAMLISRIEAALETLPPE